MKVSILIPAYNVEKYLSQCLDSVCNQTYRDIEIIVINDGSNDNTWTILSQYAKKDTRIKSFSRENKGVAITRNELLDRATGDFVLFVDSDDWIEPDMISTLVEVCEKNSVELAMCRNVIGDSTPNKTSQDIIVWEGKTILEKFLEHRELTGSLWNKLIRRDLFDGIRFQPGIGYGEDAMVMWDILNRTEKIKYTKKELYHYRMNDTSISHQGLSESKMSVIPVWEYISNSKSAIQNNLTHQAKARYGAEITLLLKDIIRSKPSIESKRRIAILQTKLKDLYPSMIKSHYLSYKFKIFAGIAYLSWPLLRILTLYTK